MRRRTSLLVLLGVAVLLGLGCEKSVTGPQGETAGTYRLGVLTSHVPADMNATYQAAEKAMKDLNLIVLQSAGSQLGSNIIARDAQDRRIEIGLTSLTGQATKMTIDAGSKTAATRIYHEIAANLPQTATAQAQAAAQP